MQIHSKRAVLVSIVIPNFNGGQMLENCLKSIKAQEYDNLEIIVVDDASSDGSEEIAKADPSVILMKNEKNSGFAYSVNRGIEAAKNPFIILLNNDVVLEEGFISCLVEAIRQDPKIFSVTSKMIRYKEPELLDDTGDFFNVFGWGWKRGDGMPVRDFKKPGEVFSACAGAAIYRSDIFDEIGLFDEEHFAYLEDIDVGWRAMIFGYTNAYEPKARCLHIGSATTAQGERHSDFKVRISARNNIYLLYKNMPASYLILNAPFLGVGLLVKYLYFLQKGYEKAYREGLAEGIKNLNKLKKVPMTRKNGKNFLRIEAKLLLNSFRYVGEKIEKAVQKRECPEDGEPYSCRMQE